MFGSTSDAREENTLWDWTEDLEWILLTTLPTDSFEDKTIGRYYEQRWVIEEYHKSLKTGLKIETAQLRTAQRILNLLGILGVVAVQMLIRRDQARTEPDRPASDLMPDKIIDRNPWRPAWIGNAG
ncbi:MAG: transposase [Chlamydiia bacterium]